MSYNEGYPIVFIIFTNSVLLLPPSNNGLFIIISAIQHPKDQISIAVE